MLLNAAQCRKHLGIKSTATWTGWTKEDGFPAYEEGENNQKLYDVDLIAAWMVENHKKDAAGSPLKEEHLKAKIAKEQELAKLAKLKREKEEGRLISKSKSEAENIKKFTFVRNRFSSLPVSLAPLVVGKSTAEAEEIIQSEVDQILEELSRE